MQALLQHQQQQQQLLHGRGTSDRRRGASVARPTSSRHRRRGSCSSDAPAAPPPVQLLCRVARPRQAGDNSSSSSSDAGGGAPGWRQGGTDTPSAAATAWARLREAAAEAFAGALPAASSAEGSSRQTTAAAAGATTYSSLLQQVAAAGTGAGGRQQQQQQQEALSFQERLSRLVSGEFIRQREGVAAGWPSSSQQQQQQQQPEEDMQEAAMRFELLQQGTDRRQQPPPGIELTAAAASAGAAPLEVQVEQPESSSSSSSRSGATLAASDSWRTAPWRAFLQPGGVAAAAAASGWRPGQDQQQQQQQQQERGFYPASTHMLVAAMWGVFVLQWAQAAPTLLSALREGAWLHLGMGLLLAFPDTGATRALCLDVLLLQQGEGWWRLVGAGLCNSGLAATWLCCAALGTCGRWLEAGTGQLGVLVLFALCAAGTSTAHVLARGCALGMSAPGAVLGMYTAWALLATRHLGDQVPLGTIYQQGAVLAAGLVALGALQPAVGWASLAGGVLGGAAGAYLGGPLTWVARWCLALPVLAGVMLVKLVWDLLKVAWLAVVFVAASIYSLTLDFVKTVKGL